MGGERPGGQHSRSVSIFLFLRGIVPKAAPYPSYPLTCTLPPSCAPRHIAEGTMHS